jgi:hypothetical protein
MEITTIDGKIYDTKKMSDIQAEMMEKCHNAGLLELAKKYNGMCFSLIGLPGTKGWSTMHIPDKESMDFLLTSVGNLLKKMSGDKFKIVVVPIDNYPKAEQ